jgi:adenylate cyclase
MSGHPRDASGSFPIAVRWVRRDTAGVMESGLATFLFADIAGFTAFTERHGDERAADLAERFREDTERLLPDGAELVKSVGDAVMVRVPTAGRAVRTGLDIATRALGADGDPGIRVGMHHGTAVERGGDYFGAGVNVAARVAAVAGPGEVLVTAPVAEAAGILPGVTLEVRGARRLRNVASPVPVLVARRAVTAPDSRLENASRALRRVLARAPLPAAAIEWSGGRACR